MFFLRKIFPTNERKAIQAEGSVLSGFVEEEAACADKRTKIYSRAGKIFEQKQALPAVLKVVSGADSGLAVPFESGQINIGRMTGSDVLLKDASISRLHAFVVSENGRHVLYDGKSTNGTFLNSQRISQKTLRHGDLIKIGNTVIVYELQ